MRVVCFCGYSGAGKTTLVERLIAVLRQRGQSVSAVKHAHHRFEMDTPGKDSWRLREAGAQEVVVASDLRLVLMREFERPAELTVHQLLAELQPSVDWVLVEGFKHSNLPKIEVWRASNGKDVLYPGDSRIVAVATDSAAELPPPVNCVVLDLDDVSAVADWLVANAHRFDCRQHGSISEN